ncbi:glycosyl hydrolase [Actinobacteria bacterium YIM 96077]|uniref:Glycosyl hydrolase n=1 Tax=Phytoactinopolyspora halophila TaxID=1981511 RepID=A0A329QG45_9ACTN|nr:glycoside hydrolase family 3 N-terminal domain-containing protein [Phytoactinopolyspora halophila]AYY15590.1 glycosyl hydrolase [Actinobacteria bacterium YIM 96077]RAW10302.1 glycosyl hydrolase [Phytoactinopolyspora halophila]
MRTHDGSDPVADALTDEHSPWRDASLPVSERIDALLAAMSLEEKVGQLYGVWVGVDPSGDEVAPHQHTLADADLDFNTLIRHGLGQLTRPFGTAAVDPVEGAKALARVQEDVVATSRFGIPAVVHEECLTGFMTLGATIYPTPLAWGATFNPQLIEQMGVQIGGAMRDVGVHQGLAPVVDVTRDPRWGRTEETIGEDPYLVGTLGAAYSRGLRSAGVIATLKHFAGYSASTAARNHAPVRSGPRELADVILPPFEMAIRYGGAGSVMPSYAEIDGMPATADPALLTDLLRETWSFDGTVVSDYFAVSFLELSHGVAGSPGEAAVSALTAGIDVELPSVRCYGEPVLEAVRSGVIPEALVDQAAARVLRQKCELGLLDPAWTPATSGVHENGAPVDLDPPEARDLARQIAEESIVLLSNESVLPLAPESRIAVVGPLANETTAMLGCYAFPSHVARAESAAADGAKADGTSMPAASAGVTIPTVVEAMRAEFTSGRIDEARGCDVTELDGSGIPEAVDAAAAADVCVVVVGDRAGLFGRGTSGEGCDAEDLHLPGLQEDLIEALLDTGTPVVVLLMSGRPYALGTIADRAGAIVQAFFPGEEGGAAVAGVLSGRVNPSGSLPVSVPRRPGGQPTTYLAPPLGHHSEVSAIDPTPLFPFGHGASYTTFAWDDPRVDGPGRPARSAAGDPAEVGTDGEITVSVRIANTGERAGSEVVQLYLHDPVAQVTRPVVQLIGYAKVPLEPGETRRVAFRVHTDLVSFTGRSGRRIVEPGDLELRLARSAQDVRHTVNVTLTGPERVVGDERELTAEVSVS